MLKFKLYRWLKSFLGYSSFTKIDDKGNTTYLLVRGDRKLVESFQKDFKQEY